MSPPTDQPTLITAFENSLVALFKKLKEKDPNLSHNKYSDFGRQIRLAGPNRLFNNDRIGRANTLSTNNDDTLKGGSNNTANLRESEASHYRFTLDDFYRWWQCYYDLVVSANDTNNPVNLLLPQINKDDFISLLYKTQLNHKMAALGWVFKIADNTGKAATTHYRLSLIGD